MGGPRRHHGHARGRVGGRVNVSDSDGAVLLALLVGGAGRAV